MKRQLAPSPIALLPQFPPTEHTQSRWAHGCIHLPLSHHNTVFKLDTARSLFFLAELIEPIRPDLPYQSVKGIFHSLQYKTQCPSVVRLKEGHTVWVHVLQLSQGARQADVLAWALPALCGPALQATLTGTPPPKKWPFYKQFPWLFQAREHLPSCGSTVCVMIWLSLLLWQTQCIV